MKFRALAMVMENDKCKELRFASLVEMEHFHLETDDSCCAWKKMASTRLAQFTQISRKIVGAGRNYA